MSETYRPPAPVKPLPAEWQAHTAEQLNERKRKAAKKALATRRASLALSTKGPFITR